MSFCDELKRRLSADYINDKKKFTNNKKGLITKIIKTAGEELTKKTYFYNRTG